MGKLMYRLLALHICSLLITYTCFYGTHAWVTRGTAETIRDSQSRIAPRELVRTRGPQARRTQRK